MQGNSSRLPILLVLGGVAGLLAGMLGVGGGLVVGPVLMMLGFPMARAFGIALAVILPVALMAVLTELAFASEYFHVWTALLLAVGGQFGARLAARMLAHISARRVRLAFLVLVLYASLRNLGLFGDLPGEALSGLANGSTSIQIGLSLGLGILAGMSAVFFGVGGGIVVVPGLVLAVGGFPVRDAMATSLLAMIPTAAIGLRLAIKAGRVESRTAYTLLPTALAGSAAGVLLRDFVVEPRQLAQFFGAFLLFVAVRLFRHKD